MPSKYEQLTMKQTKAEMLRAYDELLKKLEAKAESGLPEKKPIWKKFMISIWLRIPCQLWFKNMRKNAEPLRLK